MAQHVDAHVIRHGFFHGLLQVLINFGLRVKAASIALSVPGL